MKARWPALLLILAAACGGGSPHTLSSTSPSPGGQGGTGTGPTPSSGPLPTSLPRVVLTADLSERPAPWRLIAHIPFGHQASSLGVVLPPEHTSVPEIPVSFAVAPDGTLWVLDVVKERIAHFTSAGRYLGEVGGLSFDRFSPHPRDIAFVGERLYLLQSDEPIQAQERALVLPVDTSGGPPPALPGQPVFDGSNPLLIQYLMAGVPDLEGRSFGYALADAFSSGRHGWVGLDGTGPYATHPLDSIAVGSGRRMFLARVGDRDFRLLFVGPEGSAVQPIHFTLVTGRGTADRALPAAFGLEPDVVVRGGLAAFMMVSPTRPGDAGKYGGGRWFLEVKDDGSPIIFERLPDRGLSDESIGRNITVGADGSIYLMVAEEGGMNFYRR
ncbi:MAG TPA: hypothetical protein VEN82_07745 [Actinomycetota bacterium]|nr:hypothetical protein [Actinomycetota bacterium]